MQRPALFVALFCVLVAGHMFGQTINATLGGTVSDSTGALIPGVAITATNAATGIVSSVISNESGVYQFASLQSGTYKVTAELQGFQTAVYDQVALGLSQQVRLNFTLQVGGVAQSVEVNVAADTLLATSSSSVGTVLPDYKLRELPLGSRNAIDLVGTMSGVQRGGRDDNFAIFSGNRSNAVTTMRDGVSVNATRHNDVGAMAITYTSPDLVEEVRVIASPADAEVARGAAQVQMVTRAGTNQFRGSLFYTNRNSALEASNWFNNFRSVQKDYANRNQFGGRLGGPIVRNKTFFFFLYEGQRFRTRQSVVGNVLTETARQGIFRYFPGVQSGNAASNNPAVDFQGNPITPRGASGPLTSFSVFGRDPLRPGYDTSGWIQTALAKMPLPNDFTVGDGLNTAGIRWVQRHKAIDNNQGTEPSVDRNSFNLRLDHNFNPNNKVFFTGSLERDDSDSQIAPWPNATGGWSSGGWIKRKPSIFTASLVSTISSNLVNELRFGQRRQVIHNRSGWEKPDGDGPEVFKLFPRRNGIPYIPKPINFTENFIFGGFNGTRGNDAVRWSYADSLSWTLGRHAFRFGAELGMTIAPGYTNQQMYPYINLGAGGEAVRGIDATVFSGLSGADQTNARNLLTDLNGSVASINQAFVLNGPVNPQFIDYRGAGSTPVVPSPEKFFLRDWRQNDFSWFVKDDWKMRSNLTINLGVRWDYYSSMWDNFGLAAAPVGGNAGLFGISGGSYADQWQPGRLNGRLTSFEFVGPNSPNESRNLWKNDLNNFSPAIGVSWTLPWWGQDKTVFRAGYGMNYVGAYHISTLHNAQFSTPGTGVIPTYTQASYLSLSNFALPIPLPSAPLQPVALTDRSVNLTAFDDSMKNPYIQSYNASIQREITRDISVEVRYIGSKGSKLWGAIALNDVNIFENRILEAFNITRAGGNAPLFDQMLQGLNLGLGAVNGTTVTGSASLRQSTLTRGFLANGNVGQFADFLNSTPTGTSIRGGLLRNGGFPENFIRVNPQFNNVTFNSNPGNSTYHSLNLALNKRLSRGFTSQVQYTWSRTIGEHDEDTGTNYRNPRDRSLNKQLLGFHRTHDFRTNGVWQLPFGPGQALLANAPTWVSRLVERWQFGAIFSLASGGPLTITAPVSTVIQNTANNTPDIVGDFPKSLGEVTRVSNGVIYFDGLQQVADPAAANVTVLQGLNAQFSNRAVADANGRLLLVNPSPGNLGSLGLKWIEGPGNIGLDMNLVKKVRITETKEFEFRMDATNILNHPNFGDPVLNINSTDFGRIRTATGNRSFVLNARVNF